MKADKPTRKTIRLQDYDYASNGAYFVTICTHKRRRILSNLVGDGFHGVPEGYPVPQIELSPIGQEVENSIAYISSRYDGVVGKYVIMPNHVHMIVRLQSGGHGNPAGGHGNPPLQDVVGRIKSFTTKRYNEMLHTENETLWQRSFYDRIIRTEQEYAEVWRYIDTNPLKWQGDPYYTHTP
jgi:Transposase and inactivated derivatives